ncbi:MAG: prepilin-type N-terminal cleavage/methylation domain-containing protein [Planctomycetes bacterium]|nr:prepilin-type N-terminal cleavage/methylation domain-containing protein [Planctomycetota bacterium]
MKHQLRLAPRPRRRVIRRGFNLVELLMALAISAALLSATMVSLDASFMAYQTTTEVASTHTIGRLAINRMLTLIRTGTEFGPFPLDPMDSIVESDFIQFRTTDNNIMTIRWIETDPLLENESLYVEYDGGTYLLLEGVVAQTDAGGDPVMPFTLEYERGRDLFRATIDLAIVPDDNMDVDLDGDRLETIRLVATAMPRMAAFR